MTKQENARAVLQNERLKLKNSLLKNFANPQRSSTNEGSRSVNTFDRFKNFKINSGSSVSSPRSSLISSQEKRQKILFQAVSRANEAQVTAAIISSENEDIASSASQPSLFGNSNSNYSFYEFKSQKYINNTTPLGLISEQKPWT